MVLTTAFTTALEAAWGYPQRVADVAFSELFRQINGPDYDDQIRWAKKIGVLAGQTEKGTKEEFASKFLAMLTEE
jgi:hypothetical protein